MARRGYPAEFRRRVVDLVEGGKKVSEVATELGVSEQTIYVWRRQARIDAGLTTSEHVELANAIFEYLEIFHNRRRRHSSLGMVSPVEYEPRNAS